MEAKSTSAWANLCEGGAHLSSVRNLGAAVKRRMRPSQASRLSELEPRKTRFSPVRRRMRSLKPINNWGARHDDRDEAGPRML